MALPQDVEQNLIKGLGVRAENRFQSMQEFQTALLGQGGTSPGPSPTPHPSPPPIPVPDPIPKPIPTPVPKPNPLLQWMEQVPKWMWGAGAAAVAILLLAYLLGPDPGQSPGPEPRPTPGVSEVDAPGVDIQLTGIWQHIWTDGNNRYSCRVRLDADGHYAYLSGCHPSIGTEQGTMQVSNGTYRILSNSTGRADSGTYRLLNADRLEMSSAVYQNTTLWDRVPQQHAEPRPTPRPDPRRRTPAPQGGEHEKLTEQATEHLRNRQAGLARPLLQRALEINPDYARAHALMGYVSLYYNGDMNRGGRHYRKAYDLGGTINFRLLHDLGDAMFIRSRSGTLEVSRERALFRGDDGVRVFNTSRSSIREAKKNSKITSLFKRPRAKNSFHVKIGQDNYNLAPTTASGRQEVDLILSFLRGSRSRSRR